MLRPTSVTQFTIMVDSREKIPLRFPKSLELFDVKIGKVRRVLLETRVDRLDAGDYTLKGFEGQVVVERKGSLREIYTNLLTGDAGRQVRAFDKLRQVEARALFLEMPPTDVVAKPSQEVPSPGGAFSLLMQMCRHFGMDVLWAPSLKSSQSKIISGTLVAHYLIGTVMSQDMNKEKG